MLDTPLRGQYWDVPGHWSRECRWWLCFRCSRSFGGRNRDFGVIVVECMDTCGFFALGMDDDIIVFIIIIFIRITWYIINVSKGPTFVLIVVPVLGVRAP